MQSQALSEARREGRALRMRVKTQVMLFYVRLSLSLNPRESLTESTTKSIIYGFEQMFVCVVVFFMLDSTTRHLCL